ncbi:hypothetical protein IGI04_023600 [Brassica rapa subsp. trilocularis]|uniref:Uncharacterized protein n=1 Tax=Brassica rapa subsp. trilocularis TaxID=1813537 RepID=A0ABQ7M4C2_BRACM|nr:hypothetical protein IGI04_023600 [Brassica rapa subsp. trilocularis]
MYNIIDHPFLIRFISTTIIYEVITAKKQLESLFVSSLICKKQSTHNSLYIIIYIVLTSIIKNIFYPNYVVVYLSPLLIKLILHKPLFYTTTGDTRDNPDRHKCGNNNSTCSLLLSYKNSLDAQCQEANAIVFL